MKATGNMEQAERQEVAKALNDLARHQSITRLEADILYDMQVCDIEGWDKMEYIQMLQDLLNSFGGQDEKGNKNTQLHPGRVEAADRRGKPPAGVQMDLEREITVRGRV
jgi:hypothetical protein